MLYVVQKGQELRTTKPEGTTGQGISYIQDYAQKNRFNYN